MSKKTLPKIDLPLHEITLPSSGEKIKYRQFTVKEEKILLVAQESNDGKQELLAAKQVVNNCIYDKDISELAMVDLEYLLIILRSQSVDNELAFTIEDPDTKETINLNMNIEDIKIVKDENHTNQVKINDEYTLFLKYPTINEFETIINMEESSPLISYYIMVSCIDKIASEDEVYDFKDYDEEGINEFMENLSASVIKGIENFFETMPKLRHEIKYKNKDGKENTFVLEGMKSFFI